MLTISKALNASQVATYHRAEYAATTGNYWSREQVTPSEWFGKLATEWGLSGSVHDEQFMRLAQGQHPTTGEQLVGQRRGAEYTDEHGKTVVPMTRRAGWDATFSPAKSVSLTALVGQDDRVREAHRAAVDTALAELESRIYARMGGNTPAEQTNRMVAAKFEHDTARPVDGYSAPQLHTHVVVFNMTRRDDASFRALQEKAMFESQGLVTAIYQSELMYRLRQIGYEIEPGKTGAPEIKGYTREYIEASSPRSAQIHSYLQENNLEGSAAAQIAAHATRDKKEHHTPEETRAAHLDIAREYGNQPFAAVQTAHVNELKPREAMAQPTHDERVKEAVSWARDRNFEREAVVDERIILRDAVRRGMGDLLYPPIRENFEKRLDAGEFKETVISRYASARSITSEATLISERQIVTQIAQGRHQIQPIMTESQAETRVAQLVALNDSQRQAIREVLTNHDRVQGIQGVAGAGKTTTLLSIKEAAETQGYAVRGLAPTSSAAQKLYEEKIPAGTLQGFLASNDHIPQDPTGKRLFFVDESSLASTRQMETFLTRLAPNDRVVLVGDIRQHQGVEAGRPFEQLQDAGMATATLNVIVRQRDPELRKAVDHLSRGEVYLAVGMLKEQGRVIEIHDRDARFAAIAKDYVAQPPGSSIIVAASNAERRDLNQAVRLERQANGLLPTQGMTYSILAPRSDMTGADREWATQYHPRDVLRYSKGSEELGLAAGSYVRVIATDKKANEITVQKATGELVTYDPRRLIGITAYTERDREFAVGDRLQFTAPNKELHVANRALGTVTAINPNGSMQVLTDHAKLIDFDPAKMRHFDHGYAVTSQSSQSLTKHTCLVNVDADTHPDLLNTRFIYVAGSRQSHELRIYTHNAGNLENQLSRDVSKHSALPLERELVKVQQHQQQNQMTMA